MKKVGDYIVYKKDVCKIADIKKNHFNNQDYYLLIPIDDESLHIDVPVDNRMGYLRDLISKEEVTSVIENIPNIEIIKIDEKRLEYEYKNLLSDASHENLVKIIKTTYLRNQERINNKKKLSDKDNYYFNLAEKYLYNEFSIVLNMNYDETKEYVISKVSNLEKDRKEIC
jgi:CarD family transcriptional regulator